MRTIIGYFDFKKTLKRTAV